MSDDAARDKAAAVEAPRANIHDRGIQPYTGEHTALSRRWRVVAARMLRLTMRQTWVIVLMVLALFPALGWGVAMYIQSRLHAVGLASSPDEYVYGLAARGAGELLLAFLIALFAGGGAIADDLRTGAFQLYFARPLSPGQYLAGKLVPPVVLVLATGGVPPLLLALARLAFARDSAVALEALPLVAGAVAFAAVEALALAAPVLAVSSLSRSRGTAQGAFAALILLPWMFGALLVKLTGSPWGEVASIPAHLQNLAHALFRVSPPPGTHTMPLAGSLAALAVAVGGSLALVRHELGRVDVVAG